MHALLAVASPIATTTPLPGVSEGQSGGNVLLDAVVFVIGVGLLGGLLVWITKKILIDEKY